MACYNLSLKNEKEFYDLLKKHDPDIVIKMVSCVLNAVEKQHDKVDIFDITFNDTSEMLFSIEKNQYEILLQNCIKDLEKIEEYELCGKIKNVISKV